MSNYHILTSKFAPSVEDNETEIIFHILVPDENNTVNINLRTALKQYKPVTTSLVPWITEGAELTAIQNGEIFEYRDKIEYDAKLSNQEKLVMCDTKYTNLVPKIQEYLRKTLKYWGANRDVS